MALPISYQGIKSTPPQKHGQPGLTIAPETAVPAGQAQQHPLTLEEAKSAFLRALAGKNRTASTITAYATDLAHFLSWLHCNNIVATAPHHVQRADITDYLAHLAQQSLMGVSRARKLAAIHEFFRFLESNGSINKNPAQGIETPKKEKNGRVYLRPDEYRSMLSLAGGNPRDFAILQVFLQTGIRVSELCNLRLSDIDFAGRTLKVVGKGMVEREIDLEKKGLDAIKNYLAIRPQTFEDRLFLNYQGQPLGERGVRKLVRKYKDQAGITKRASPPFAEAHLCHGKG